MSTPDHRPTLPAPRGALSERTLDALRTDPGALAPHADELAHVEAADRALTLRVGQPARLHAHLIAEAMAALGLSTRPAASLDECPRS